jgi:hypothetical protein
LALLYELLFFLILPFNQTLFFIFYINFDPHSFNVFGSFAKLTFLFNFTLQSNLKFILYFYFVPHSFNCYFF